MLYIFIHITFMQCLVGEAHLQDGYGVVEVVMLHGGGGVNSS